MEPTEIIKYKGYNIEVYPDEDPEDPREWDNLGTMICFHNRYCLGDRYHGLNSDMFAGWDDLENHLEKNLDAVLIYPLFLYDHGGITIKIGSFYGLLPEGHARFDSGQVGFIYTTRKRLLLAFNWKSCKSERRSRIAQRFLENEVRAYDDYLTGNVYGYVIRVDNEEDLDTCWGYSGDYNKSDLLKDAKAQIEYIIDTDLRTGKGIYTRY